MNDLTVYVWDSLCEPERERGAFSPLGDILCDWTWGAVFVVARDEDHAWELLKHKEAWNWWRLQGLPFRDEYRECDDSVTAVHDDWVLEHIAPRVHGIASARFRPRVIDSPEVIYITPGA